VSARTRGTLYLCFFAPFTALMALMAIGISIVDRRGGVFHRHSRLWARVALWCAGVRVAVQYTQQLPTGTPLIFMSNHQGNFDIPALYAAIPRPFSWMAKEELFRIPLFGWALSRAGYIPVDRSDGRKSFKSLMAAAKTIRGGKSVVIFPEGTRSPDGALLPFKRGGFILAATSKVPVVPVAISGSREVNPPQTTLLTPGVIRVRIGGAVPTEGRPPADIETEVESAIRSLLEAP